MNKRLKKKKGLYNCKECGNVMTYQKNEFWGSKKRECRFIHKGTKLIFNMVHSVNIID